MRSEWVVEAQPCTGWNLDLNMDMEEGVVVQGDWRGIRRVEGGREEEKRRDSPLPVAGKAKGDGVGSTAPPRP